MQDARREEGFDLEATLMPLARAAGETATAGTAAAEYARLVLRALSAGGRLFLCGNGGSASTTEHVAAEYVVRLRRARAPLPALALSTCTATLTAAANDLGFEWAYARILRAHARAGDLLVLHSTSGASANLLRAAEAAGELGVDTVALLGRDGGPLEDRVTLALKVAAVDPARIQELHLAVEHAVVGWVESRLSSHGEEEG